MDETGTIDTAAGHDDEALDARGAAALLEESERSARRRFDTRKPLLLIAAVPFFVLAYGALWWGTRHQHPYSGPPAWALVVLYSVVVAWAVTASTAYRRATRGVRGRSHEQRAAEAVAFATVWIAVYVIQGALHHAGAGDAIAYGIYPASAPLVFVGGAAATNAAARADWRSVGPLLLLVAVACGAAFAPASTAWLVAGCGLAAALVALAVVHVRPRAA